MPSPGRPSRSSRPARAARRPPSGRCPCRHLPQKRPFFSRGGERTLSAQGCRPATLLPPASRPHLPQDPSQRPGRASRRCCLGGSRPRHAQPGLRLMTALCRSSLCWRPLPAPCRVAVGIRHLWAAGGRRQLPHALTSRSRQATIWEGSLRSTTKETSTAVRCYSSSSPKVCGSVRAGAATVPVSQRGSHGRRAPSSGALPGELREVGGMPVKPTGAEAAASALRALPGRHVATAAGRPLAAGGAARERRAGRPSATARVRGGRRCGRRPGGPKRPRAGAATTT